MEHFHKIKFTFVTLKIHAFLLSFNVSLTNLPLPLGFPVRLMTSLTSRKDQDRIYGD